MFPVFRIFFRGRRRCVSRYFSNREVKRDDKLMSIEMNLLKHETRKKLRLFPSQTNRNGCGLKLVRNVPSNTITTINQCFSRFFGSDFYRNSNLFFGHYQIRIVFLPDFTELKRVPRMSHNDDAVNISLSHAKRSSLSPNLHGHQNHFSHETWNSSDDLELRSTTKNQKIRRMWSTMQRLVTEPIFQSVFAVTL